MGETFNGIGFIGYDNVSKKYVSTWMDTAGTGMMWSTGTMDASGKVLSMKATVNDPSTGKASPVDRRSRSPTTTTTSWRCGARTRPARWPRSWRSSTRARNERGAPVRFRSSAQIEGDQEPCRACARSSASFSSFCLSGVTAGPLAAQTRRRRPLRRPPPDPWPRQVKSGTTTFLIYQPQLDSWSANQLEGHAAVVGQDGRRQGPDLRRDLVHGAHRGRQGQPRRLPRGPEHHALELSLGARQRGGVAGGPAGERAGQEVQGHRPRPPRGGPRHPHGEEDGRVAAAEQRAARRSSSRTFRRSSSSSTAPPSSSRRPAPRCSGSSTRARSCCRPAPASSTSTSSTAG